MKKNIDLGKYDLNQLLRNPGLIHRIQDKLRSLDGGKLILTGGSIGMAIVAYRDMAIDPLIKILYKEERQKVIELIGKDIMDDILEYMGETPDDLPPGLFQAVNLPE